MPLMPSPAPPAAAGPRRRSLLAGAVSTLGALCGLGALGATAGCSADASGTDGEAMKDSPAARRLRAKAAGQSRALLEQYDATAAAHASLAKGLRPLRSAVARHAKALGGRKAAHVTGKSDTPVPDSADEALAALAASERRTADARTTALVDAPPELAGLLASVAAAGAAHAYLLGRLDADGGDGDGGDGDGGGDSGGAAEDGDGGKEQDA